ncbi:SDR family oxidoreductase [Burkholderia sp. BCC1999]|uniref:SDR family NAD(P)-dependent oxidoreductase n=1 Tax=Burkholderia sp. BCC1999 TaxID=2817448 RepID=UPI002AC3479E|nr:SDR family oxidoreductase [Burkholderia sp. BCC1999]
MTFDRHRTKRPCDVEGYAAPLTATRYDRRTVRTRFFHERASRGSRRGAIQRAPEARRATTTGKPAMKIMIIGASRGLGRALAEGVCSAGDTVIGVSRLRPDALVLPQGVELQWIEADMASPAEAAAHIAQAAPAAFDVLICNVGIWETAAFTDGYAFLDEPDDAIVNLVNVNLTATLLLLKRLVPRLLQSAKPQVILTGSTSALRQSGRPEVAFGASKFALNGVADALREGFRSSRLAVTCLQLGNLNTDDALSVPLEAAAARGEGGLVPVHDVVAVVRTLLRLSDAAFVRELVMPAIADERF